MAGLTIPQPMPMKTWNRFFSKVHIPQDRNQCWLWTASKFQHGYGCFVVSCKPRRTTNAHRVAYQIFKGPILGGLELDHLCRNRLCVNPDHLEAVTHTENLRRAPHFNRERTHCKNGHPFDSTNTRLTETQRVCRECHRIVSAENHRRAKEKNPDKIRTQASERYLKYKKMKDLQG